MRKVREVLRLKHALGIIERPIAEVVGAGKSAVGEYIRRARVLGLTWPLPDGLDDAELERPYLACFSVGRSSSPFPHCRCPLPTASGNQETRSETPQPIVNHDLPRTT